MAIEDTVSSDFYPRSSIVKSVFDCRLPGVSMGVYWKHLRLMYLHSKAILTSSAYTKNRELYLFTNQFY